MNSNVTLKNEQLRSTPPGPGSAGVKRRAHAEMVWEVVCRVEDRLNLLETMSDEIREGSEVKQPPPVPTASVPSLSSLLTILPDKLGTFSDRLDEVMERLRSDLL